MVINGIPDPNRVTRTPETIIGATQTSVVPTHAIIATHTDRGTRAGYDDLTSRFSVYNYAIMDG